LDGSSSWNARSPRTIRFPIPDVKINQISCGRSHLLALSDNGEIWSVRGNRFVEEPALIQPVEDLGHSGGKENNRGLIKKVVAGWTASGVLVEGYGIMMWFDEHPDQTRPGSPTHVRNVNMKDIPYLSYLNTSPASMKYCKEDPVVDFTIGEHFVVAVTASGRVYAARIGDVQNDNQIAPVELLKFRAPSGQPPISRVEGKFRRFGVFNRNGLVHLIDDADGLDRMCNAALNAAGSQSDDLDAMRSDAVAPQVVEELTKHNIVDVAFGDWHYLALTDTGKVLSWGTECQSCGSLGLGPSDVADQRGVHYQLNRDGVLDVPQIISFGHPYAEKDHARDGKPSSGPGPDMR
jgi:SCF-associated factor 1